MGSFKGKFAIVALIIALTGCSDDRSSVPSNAAVPIADTSVQKKRIILEGSLPSVMDPPKGCAFNTRCPRKIGRICETEAPPHVEAAGGHLIACHIPLAELREVSPVIVLAGSGDGETTAAE